MERQSNLGAKWFVKPEVLANGSTAYRVILSAPNAEVVLAAVDAQHAEQLVESLNRCVFWEILLDAHAQGWLNVPQGGVA